MTPEELKEALLEKFIDPVARIEGTFNIRRADGSLVKLKVPKSQREILRRGILGTGIRLNKQGLTYRRIITKGRQQGFSIILAAETLLIAQDYPNAFQYYIASKGEQAISWLGKVEDLAINANHYPEEMGGGSMIDITSITNQTKKIINNCTLVGFAANPAGIRGDTGINGIMDETAWMVLRKNQQSETYAAFKYFFRQGGQITLQSTPRVSDDMFFEMYEHSEQHGFEAFYKPTIENWKDLNLDEPLFIDLDNERRKLTGDKTLTTEEVEKLKEKFLKKSYFWYNKENKSIEQKAEIPYSWIKLADLEKDRYSDIQIFKQENLGIPVDERYKLIKGEWIYTHTIEDEEDWEDRRDSYNPFYFGLDYAQKRDLTILKVIEKIGQDFYVRCAKIITGKYTAQAAEIVDFYNRFKPLKIRGDDTGVGIPIHDILEKSISKNILERVTFTSDSKKNMAENFKNICQDGHYHMLNYSVEHSLIIKHILKVEKDVGETSIRYTGKGVDQEGRDDGFWASALSVFEKAENKGKTPVKSAFGRNRRIENKEDLKKNNAQRLVQSLKKESLKVPVRNEIEGLHEIHKKENMNICLNELRKGILICPKANKPIRPLKCLTCNRILCVYYRTHKEIFKSYGFEENNILEELEDVRKNKILDFHSEIK